MLLEGVEGQVGLAHLPHQDILVLPLVHHHRHDNVVLPQKVHTGEMAIVLVVVLETRTLHRPTLVPRWVIMVDNLYQTCEFLSLDNPVPVPRDPLQHTPHPHREAYHR